MENAALGTEQEILTQTITRLEGERAAKHQESEEKHQRQMQALKDRFAEREKELKDESQVETPGSPLPSPFPLHPSAVLKNTDLVFFSC